MTCPVLSRLGFARLHQKERRSWFGLACLDVASLPYLRLGYVTYFHQSGDGKILSYTHPFAWLAWACLGLICTHQKGEEAALA